MIEDPSLWVSKSEDHDGHDLEKHRSERADNGFSTYDWWNFDGYLAWIIWHACERFKTGHGYPAELESPEEWVLILSQIQAGLEAHKEIDQTIKWADKEYMKGLYDVRRNGLNLLARWLPSFWD